MRNQFALLTRRDSCIHWKVAITTLSTICGPSINNCIVTQVCLYFQRKIWLLFLLYIFLLIWTIVQFYIQRFLSPFGWIFLSFPQTEPQPHICERNFSFSFINLHPRCLLSLLNMISFSLHLTFNFFPCSHPFTVPFLPWTHFSISNFHFHYESRW